MYICLGYSLIKLCAEDFFLHSCLPFGIVGTPKHPLMLQHSEALCRRMYAQKQRKGSWVILERITQTKFIHWQSFAGMPAFSFTFSKIWLLIKKQIFSRQKILQVKWSNTKQKEGGKIVWKLSQKQKAYLVLIHCLCFIYANKCILNIYYINI